MWWEMIDGGVTNDGDDDKALFGGISSFVPRTSSWKIFSSFKLMKFAEVEWTWMNLDEIGIDVDEISKAYREMMLTV